MSIQTPVEGADAPKRRRRPTNPHLLDYFRVVRSHWLLATVVFLAVFGLKIYDALMARPVYEARSIIQVERSMPSQQGGFSPIASFNLTLVTAAELEVLRSFPVALLAAAVRESGAIASITEKNEYRPLETALRSVHGSWRPCRLMAYARPLAKGSALVNLTFDESGRSIRASVAGGQTIAEFGPEQWDWGEPYDDENHNFRRDAGEPFTDQNRDGIYDPGKPLVLSKDEVTLVKLSGNPANRTFLLTRRSQAKAAHWLQGGATAREVSEFTGILSVGFRTDSPVLSASAANALAVAYVAYKEQQQREEVDARVAWLQIEVNKIEGNLEALEQVRDSFVAREGGAVLLGQQASALLTEQRELMRERLDFEVRLKAVESRLAELEDEGRTLDEKLLYLALDTIDAETSVLVSQLSPLRIERNVLLSLEEVTADNPKVLALDARIHEIEKSLDVRVQAIVSRQRKLVAEKETEIRRRMETIDIKNEELRTEIEELPVKERKFIQKSRPIEIHEELFNYLTKAKMESEMARESVVSRVHILDPAVAPSTRQSPKVTSTGIIAIVLGALAALAAVFLREYLIRAVTNPQTLEDELGLTVYAAIPDYKSVKRRERKGIPRKRGLVSIHAPNSILTESYRTLRANIKFSSPAGPPRTLAITSPVEQEGKSVTTLNLAVVMAQAGDRVLVVDADMRRPSTHLYLPGPKEPGLVEVLSGEVDWRTAVTGKVVPGLDVLHAGRSSKDPSALLDAPKFQEFLEEITQAYDYVLFDVPPVLAVADASAFFRKLDGVLLLTRYRRCTVDTIDGALEQVERIGGNVLGIIFNGFDARASARRGYGYYGSYGSYKRYGGEAGGNTGTS